MPSEPAHDLEATTQLVRAAQNGDAAALDALLVRYLPRVRQIVALRMGHRVRQMVEVEDIVQEVLLDLLKGLERVELRSQGSFRNWLARCVEREIIDTRRMETRRKRGGGAVRRFGDLDPTLLTSSIFGADPTTPSAHARANELAELLEEAILELPEHHRELILLRCVCGMSWAEITAELGLSDRSTVRVAFSKVIRKLEKRVGV